VPRQPRSALHQQLRAYDQDGKSGKNESDVL